MRTSIPITVTVGGIERPIGHAEERSGRQYIGYVQLATGRPERVTQGYQLEDVIALVLAAYSGPQDIPPYDPIAF